MEQVVSRSDLHSPAGTSPSSPDITTDDNSRHLGQFEYIDYQAAKTNAPDVASEDGHLDFCLFANPVSLKQTAQRIRLRTPTPEHAEPAFIDPSRPHSHYFTTSNYNDTFKQAALTGQQVLLQSKIVWPGSSYEWRVVQLPPSSLTKAVRRIEAPTHCSGLATDGAISKRQRPGKKTRIRCRRMHEAERRQREKASRPPKAPQGRPKRAAAEEKHEAGQPLSGKARVEKSARNREKKLNRRAREKKKKVVLAAEAHSGSS